MLSFCHTVRVVHLEASQTVSAEPVIELGLMAYHQNASAICDQCTLQFVLGIHIEVVGGLVEDEYIGGTVDQLAETHLCLFTAGQDFDKAFNMLGCKAAFARAERTSYWL